MRASTSATSAILLALLASPALSAPISTSAEVKELSRRDFNSNLLAAINKLFGRSEELAARGPDGLDLTDLGFPADLEFGAPRVPDPSPPCTFGTACLAIARRSDGDDSLSRRISTTTEEEPSTGAQIAAGAAGGAASGAVGNILSKIESLFRREFTDSDAEVFARDFKSTMATLSPSDQQTVKTALMTKVSTLKDSGLATRGAAGAIGGAVAGGAASAVVGNILSSIENLFRRDEFELAERKELVARDFLGIGTQDNAVVGLFNEIKGLFRRDFTNADADAEVFARDFKSTMAMLSPDDQQTVKTALANKLSTLNDSELAARGAAGAIGGAVAGGAASAVIGNLLTTIEGLFRRHELELELAERGIGGALAGGAASGLLGNLLGQVENLFRRELELQGDILARTEGWIINELD